MLLYQRKYFSPDGSEGGGEGGEQKFAGKYETVEDLEKGYKELESSLSSHAERTKAAEERAKKFESAVLDSSKGAKDQQPAEKKSSANDELNTFVETTEWDELTGKELALANSKLTRLTLKAEKEAEHLERESKKNAERKMTEAMTQRDVVKILGEIGEKSESEQEKVLNGVEKYMAKHDIDSPYAAFQKMQAEQLRSELDEVKKNTSSEKAKQEKEKEEAKKNRFHTRPESHKDSSEDPLMSGKTDRERSVNARRNPKLRDHFSKIREMAMRGEY